MFVFNIFNTFNSFNLKYSCPKNRESEVLCMENKLISYFFFGNDSPFLNTSRAALIILSS